MDQGVRDPAADAEANTVRWEPNRSAAPAPATGFVAPPIPVATGLWRGARGLCPVCGEGRAFRTYLGVVDRCGNCAAPLGRLRADDAPPYIVIFLVGHILVPPVFWIERAYQPPMWLHMAVWLPLFAVLCTLMLRPVKGMVLGWMLRLGFADGPGEDDDAPAPAATAAAAAATAASARRS